MNLALGHAKRQKCICALLLRLGAFNFTDLSSYVAYCISIT